MTATQCYLSLKTQHDLLFSRIAMFQERAVTADLAALRDHNLEVVATLRNDQEALGWALKSLELIITLAIGPEGLDVIKGFTR